MGQIPGQVFSIAAGESPINIVLVFVLLALLPFLFLSVTSYIKLSVVFGILRNALGAQQIPSGAVVSLLSLVLTLQIMAPVGRDILLVLEKGDQNTIERHSSVVRKKQTMVAAGQVSIFVSKAKEAAVPLERFLRRHSKFRERAFFAGLGGLSAVRTDEANSALAVDDGNRQGLRTVVKQQQPNTEEAFPGESLFTLLPAFLVSELTQAFGLGFALYLPFLVVDLVVANVLAAMGMMMVSPVTIALPIKLILFVLADGWFLLARGLVLSYR